MTDLFARAAREVADSHDLFQAMGRGEAQFDAAIFDRTMPPGFRLVTPDGAVMERAEIVAHLADLARLGDPAFEIRIHDVAESWRSEAGVVLTYVEAQVRRGVPTRRRSTALFLPDDAAPNRVVWRHLHETWMPMT
ncbi:MAG TPA: DUF4440 domain-containing protein [Methylomirabilota bacterium]|nr:DUF4440 domain-containing protein [Methylomirabilota bacterium]